MRYINLYYITLHYITYRSVIQLTILIYASNNCLDFVLFTHVTFLFWVSSVFIFLKFTDQIKLLMCKKFTNNDNKTYTPRRYWIESDACSLQQIIHTSLKSQQPSNDYAKRQTDIRARSVQTKYWLLLSGRTARANDLNLDWIDRSLSTLITLLTM